MSTGVTAASATAALGEAGCRQCQPHQQDDEFTHWNEPRQRTCNIGANAKRLKTLVDVSDRLGRDSPGWWFSTSSLVLAMRYLDL
jgi:hypothetical protein